MRWGFLDQLLSVGVAKIPAYWLGAFFNPLGFLSAVTQVGKGLIHTYQRGLISFSLSLSLLCSKF